MMVYKFHILNILQYFWGYVTAGGIFEKKGNCLN